MKINEVLTSRSRSEIYSDSLSVSENSCEFSESLSVVSSSEVSESLSSSSDQEISFGTNVHLWKIRNPSNVKGE